MLDRIDTESNFKEVSREQSESKTISQFVDNSENSIYSNLYENLNKELSDSCNGIVKDEIEKLISLNIIIEKTQSYYERISNSQISDEKINQNLMKEKEKELAFNYQYHSNQNGLEKLVLSFLSNKANQTQNFTLPQKSKSFKSDNSIKFGCHSKKELISQQIKNISNEELEFLDGLYSYLGHEVYLKILIVYGKYSIYGKSHSNSLMDYSQFSTFLSQNLMYDQFITKRDSELIFNRIKKECKSVNFSDFTRLLIELSKLVFDWEKDDLKSLSHFIEQYFIKMPCFKKTEEERNLERWYHFLEFQENILEIKCFLPSLHKIFVKYKIKDLRVSEAVETYDFIKMCKDFSIIPLFLTTKEITNIINFVNNRKKNLLPKSNLNFIKFVEVICIISLQSFDRHSSQNQNLNHVEKLKIFLNYLSEKC